MRWLCVCLSLACVPLVYRAPARADDAAVKEVLEKVTKALGGDENADKLKAVFLKAKAVANDGTGTSIRVVISFQGFEMLNAEIGIGVPNEVDSAIYVVNGDQCWVKSPKTGATFDATKAMVQPFRQVMFATIVAASPANMHGADLKIEHGGHAKVGDTDAVILRISRNDEPDVLIYYDKKTNLPLKCETKLRELKLAKEIPYVFQFSEFKELDGTKYFSKVKIIRDGREVCEFEVNEIKVAQKFEDTTFTKP